VKFFVEYGAKVGIWFESWGILKNFSVHENFFGTCVTGA
jgi:hypothetical protein